MSRKTTPTRRRVGRPAKKAMYDFAIADAEPEFQDRLKEYQKRGRGSRGRLMPCERAAEDMVEWRKQMGNISVKRYLNIRSECQYSRVPISQWPVPGDYDPPDHLPNPVGRKR